MDHETKELLQMILTEVREVKQRVDRLEQKVDRNHGDTVSAIANVVEVVGSRIQETERLLVQRVDDMESVTAQNAYDVQLMKRKNA